MRNFTQQIPLSLYIHFPWCVRKCPYCDFNSHALKQELPEMAYINALIADLEQDLPRIWGRGISSIFMGGGTPSLFSAAAMDHLLTAIKSRLRMAADIEITMEANPGTVEQSKFEGFRQAGINRLSIGIQSFQADKLKALGRIHDQHQAIQAAQTAKQAGFNNFNLDLMHGLPQQTIAEALQDLETAIGLGPTHLSWYQLTLEPNTFFYRHPPTLPEDDMIWEMQEQGKNLLASCGFSQYEISAYARNNLQSRHNLNYWEFGDYLGIGAGAHSKITDFANMTVRRLHKVKHPKDYLDSNKSFIAEEKIVSATELPLEFMMNALRLNKTISIRLFTERTGLDLSVIDNELNQAKRLGLLNVDSGNITVTRDGQKFLNNLLEIFLS